MLTISVRYEKRAPHHMCIHIQTHMREQTVSFEGDKQGILKISVLEQ